MKNRKYIVIAMVAFACLCMGIVDAIIQPGYVMKSIIKMILFLLLPTVYALCDNTCHLKRVLIPDKNGLLIAFGLGGGVYIVIVTAYMLFRNIFDFSSLTDSVTSTTGVAAENFLWVALYISFVNSFLEEFFFRGFAFLTLKTLSNRKTAYIVSAAFFAVYHIAMMIGWVAVPAITLMLVGLFIGGLIFNYFNEKYNHIYLSWIIHMFANFATNTIGFLLFSS